MIDDQTAKYAKSLYHFIKDKYNFEEKPSIIFKNDEENSYQILGKTGHYDPDAGEIVVYVANRHPKDILRSLAHELIHHIQVYEGKMTGDRAAPTSDPNYIVHDNYLKEMERDAFDRGNITFREWEASVKMNKEVIDEGKKKKGKKKRKLTTKQYNKAKEMASSMEKKQDYSAEEAHKIAFAQVQKESLEHIMSENKDNKKEVEINQVLKDSNYYRPEDRACNEVYTARDELIFQEMLKKFGIKK